MIEYVARADSLILSESWQAVHQDEVSSSALVLLPCLLGTSEITLTIQHLVSLSALQMHFSKPGLALHVWV